ncbi:hypothetical protein SYK_02870 [Pseudodesulfovibrio nedwellii]|uniref:Uncharacterized protein n=1 Tax=Pseudodesulfovibrio nedwellii TaxID=2973072 RepID=A0ABM8AWM2_9BACT|nr:hypothetical protein [Pseudodesulfovibrio nedwellii]BDQ35927.1 hypothetical protein SYK_02870 [Pseudodesulfovibrio nedwellii]
MSNPKMLIKDGTLYPHNDTFAAMDGFEVATAEQVAAHSAKVEKVKGAEMQAAAFEGEPGEDGEITVDDILTAAESEITDLEGKLVVANQTIAERDQTIVDLNVKITRLETEMAQVKTPNVESGSGGDGNTTGDNTLADPLENMSHDELDTHASGLGMNPFPANKNKAEKIAAINTHQAE